MVALNKVSESVGLFEAHVILSSIRQDQNPSHGKQTTAVESVGKEDGTRLQNQFEKLAKLRWEPLVEAGNNGPTLLPIHVMSKSFLFLP